jgi:hypothetical protein
MLGRSAGFHYASASDCFIMQLSRLFKYLHKKSLYVLDTGIIQ